MWKGLKALWNRNNLFLFLNFCYSFALCYGVKGDFPRIHDVFLIWFIINCLWFKKYIFYVAFVFLVIFALYAPIGFQYGYPNIGMLASVYETNRAEVLEFWDGKTIILLLISIFSLMFTIILTNKIVKTERLNKFFKVTGFILGILFSASIFHEGWSYSKMLNFMPAIYSSKVQYMQDKKQMEKILAQRPDWIVNEQSQRYKNYVLIIGESVQKAYLSSYGYPIETSPFLKQVNGKQYNNVIAPASYTILSIPRLLSINDKTVVEYQNNVVSLAKKANMKTYWLSNQHKFGVYDSPISYIAMQSDNAYFSNMNIERQALDGVLLPKIQQAISEGSPKNKLIVIHLMGSHAKFCERLDKNKKQFNFKDKDFSCYLSSLLQTDDLIAQIYGMLKKNGQPFTILYLSDHGLMIDKLKHGVTRESLQIPLFVINSDDSDRKVNDKFISGMDFIWFLRDWLALEVDNPKQKYKKDYEQNHAKNIYFFDKKLIHYDQLKPNHHLIHVD